MIPIIEFSGWLAILITVAIILFRIYYCTGVYDKKFIMEILIMSLITSLMWLAYGVYKKFRPLIIQFLVVCAVYILILMYMYRTSEKLWSPTDSLRDF
jgi:hypothetical protein